MWAFISFLAFSTISARADSQPLNLKPIQAILQQPDNQIDLAKAKLVIDKMINPLIDVDANLKLIDTTVAKIQAMLPPNASSQDKLDALRTYLYTAGPWNNQRPYQYDFDDPLGQKISNKLLPTYMASRKGNCVSMPYLFIILGQRLGLDVTAALAPLHVLVKYRESSANYINLEATSGANPARDVWIRQQFIMTNEAIANGIYLRPLSKKETVAAMMLTLAEYYMHQQHYEQGFEVANLVLAYDSKSVDAMLHKGSGSARLIKERFVKNYPSPNQIPQAERPDFERLAKDNQYWYQQAESLGWREPTQAEDAKYLQTMRQYQQPQQQ